MTKKSHPILYKELYYIKRLLSHAVVCRQIFLLLWLIKERERDKKKTERERKTEKGREKRK